MNEILSIHDLSVNYGGIEAVKGISFDVHEGEIVTLIGANGAGKSSTLRTIAGLVKPSGGTINFRGDNITGRDATTIVKKGITLVPEGRHIFPDLTVLENLKVGAYLRSDDISGDIQWVYDLFPRLRERSWQAGGTLSGGRRSALRRSLCAISLRSSVRSTTRAYPFCSSSRTRTWRSRSPTPPTSWRPDASRSPARAKTF